jgi:hypothetical protein
MTAHIERHESTQRQTHVHAGPVEIALHEHHGKWTATLLRVSTCTVLATVDGETEAHALHVAIRTLRTLRDALDTALAELTDHDEIDALMRRSVL